jgi:hypothetical protein
MTEPTNPDPAEDADDATELPAPAELSDQVVADLRALLRDEPVDDDDLARERRIRAALDAFTPAAETTQGPVPVPRRRSGRGLLVAAAVVAIVGVGGLFVAGIARSGGDDSASMETADSAATTTESGAAADRTPAPQASAGADGGSSDAEMPPGAAGSAEATSTVPLDRAQAPTVAVDDLGAHADEQSLRAAIAAGTAGLGLDTPRSNDPAVLPCVAQQRAAGVVVLGVATVGDRVVVVVDAAAGPQLLDPLTCTAR